MELHWNRKCMSYRGANLFFSKSETPTMQSPESILAHSYDRRPRHLGDNLVLDSGLAGRRRRIYKSPELELLADFGEGGTEPIRLQD